jgi:predicted Rdx family selenoprotein
MTTALDIIRLCLKDIGVLSVGQTPQPEDVSDALLSLNFITAGWNRNRWLIDDEVETICQSTGQLSYTIGLGGNFNCVRPDKIQASFARLTYAVSQQASPVDYSEISLKDLVSYPTVVFYDSAYPMGNLYFYPVPTINFELHVITKNNIPVYALTDTINLPPEYCRAMRWNLSAELMPMYGRAITPDIVSRAEGSLSDIITANTQIQNAKMPSGLPGTRKKSWRGRNYGGIFEGTFTMDEDTLG